MTAATILCYAILLLLPAMTLRCALQCQKFAQQPGAKGAYPTEHAPSTPDAWAYVQKLAGGRLILFSILTLICGVGFMMLMPFADTVSLLCCVGIALGLEVVVLLIGMTTIGMSIQSHFKTAAI